MNYVIIALVALCTALGSLGYWQYDRANEAAKSLATSETARKEESLKLIDGINKLNQTVDLIKAQREEDQDNIHELSKAINRASVEVDNAKATLESYRNRITKDTLGRPSLLEYYAARKLDVLFLDMERATTPGEDNDGDAGVAKAGPTAAPASSSPKGH